MIYLVSKTQELFKTDLYEKLSPEKALEMLENEEILGADTETEGLNFLTKRILTIQLGNEKWQIVWDCTTIDPQLLKPILESKTLLFWNAQFDLLFLYKLNIWPSKVIDLMLQEQLLYLGIDASILRLRCEDEFGVGYTPFSLKTAAKRYCNVTLNKEVRGKIIKVGLTPEVIEYSAKDVAYEPVIYEKQLELLDEKELIKAAKLENAFVKALAYTKFCGIKLDINKWKAKMKDDNELLEKNLKLLNEWVINFWEEHKTSDISKIQLELRIGKNYKGQYEDISPNLPKNSELVSGRTEIEYDEEGERILYNIGLYNIPFGYTMRGKFHPYIFRELQGDLFTGFNTDPQCAINWNSTGQIIPLFEMLGFNLETINKKTKLPTKSVDSKIIKAQKHISSIANPYLEYKKAEKVCSTYGQNWLDAIDVDGRIHGDFNQLGAATARLSSGGELKLNLQNIPSDEVTRACFVCEKGNKWISEDYQAQEGRLIASVANEKSMIDLFNNNGDIHSLVAYMAFRQIPRGTKNEDISTWAKEKKVIDGIDYHKLRFDAKGVEFGIVLII